VRSLRRQTELDDASVYCFLDGSVNRFSGVRRASPERIASCARSFAEAFPQEELHVSPVNVGVALSYDRAERYLFLEKRHEHVLFLEDDLVLQPHYVSVIRALIREFGDQRRVGAFSAFGDHDATLAEQRARRHAIREMGHSWAYCVPRARWLETRRHYAPYLRYISGVDYVLRSNDRIWRLYRRLGVKPVASSQDGAKSVAMLRAGQLRVSTFTNNGRYIGRRGVHFSPAIYARLGYGEREKLVFTEAEDRFEWTTADLDAIEAAFRDRFLL
jgi:hypothetical protein